MLKGEVLFDWKGKVIGLDARCMIHEALKLEALKIEGRDDRWKETMVPGNTLFFVGARAVGLSFQRGRIFRGYQLVDCLVYIFPHSMRRNGPCQ